jgi:ATP-binding protein involved in chromosome partitioning
VSAPAGVADRCVLVVSGKGGVGKSTLCVALAAVLRRHFGQPTGIVDCDLSSPSVAAILGGTPPAVASGLMRPADWYGVAYLSMGLFGPVDEAFVWTGPMLQGILSQFFVETDWSGVGTLLVDLPPGVSETHLEVLELCRPVGALVVSTPHELARASTARQLAFLQARSVPVLCLVDNMAVVACPFCGEPFSLEAGGVSAEVADAAPVVRLPISAELAPDGLRRLATGAPGGPPSDPAGAPAGGLGGAAASLTMAALVEAAGYITQARVGADAAG